jgi:hypothetical protein
MLAHSHPVILSNQQDYNMFKYFLLGLIFFAETTKAAPRPFYKAGDKRFQYTGRVDFNNPALPKFWAPGVYIIARFKGPDCSLQINDGMQYGKHNYISVVIDNGAPRRIMLTGKSNVVDVAKGLRGKVHQITICKATESGLGYLEFVGMRCAGLLEPPPRPARKIEFIGNSITCGTGADASMTPCGKAEWHDQHDAYRSYAAVTARALKAQWQLSAVSGIGLMHSCCNMKITMPKVFDKTVMYFDSLPWDFAKYVPDLVTVCLGQNDGIQDSVAFCGAYVDFIKEIKSHYPGAAIVCLTSPMADSALAAVMRNYLTGVVGSFNDSGDHKVYKYFFSKRYHNGCDNHPSVEEHAQIAGELTAFIRKELGW